jgi:hypothetical protein
VLAKRIADLEVASPSSSAPGGAASPALALAWPAAASAGQAREDAAAVAAAKAAKLLASRGVLRVIVGKGLHSAGGEASLPRVVQGYLLKRGLRWAAGGCRSGGGLREAGAWRQASAHRRPFRHGFRSLDTNQRSWRHRPLPLPRIPLGPTDRAPVLVAACVRSQPSGAIPPFPCPRFTTLAGVIEVQLRRSYGIAASPAAGQAAARSPAPTALAAGTAAAAARGGGADRRRPR